MTALIEDHPEGGVAHIVAQEIDRDYRLDEVPFEAGDVVLDVGAHVGVVSTWIARRYPDVQIYAFEPIPENFERLTRNLAANGITNVVAENCAVTGDGRDVELVTNMHDNSGASTAYAERVVGTRIAARSITLQDVFSRFDIEKCKLLKIDAEGAEYEIFGSASLSMLPIDYIRGEFHVNEALRRAGRDPLRLADQLVRPFQVRLRFNDEGFINGLISEDGRLRVAAITMAD